MIVKVSFRIYYAKTIILNKSRGDYKNPCIVVFNHPATLMDALNAAANIRPVVYFFANAGLYKSAIGNWFFSRFYCIPIQRYKDTGGKPLNNANSFSKGIEHLSSGGTLMIAPEGSSYSEKKLRKIKTGAARVALDTEKANDFQLGLAILPVGLNYEAPRFFRKNVVVNIGEPILVKNYKADWEEDPIKAMRAITEKIRFSFEDLLTATEDAAEERILVQLETLQQSETPLPPKEEFFRSKKTLTALRAFHQNAPDKYSAFQKTLDDYFQKIQKLGIRDLVVKEPKNTFLIYLKILLGFPFFLFGVINNFLPAFIATKLNQKLNPEPVYDSTFKYMAGLLLFPLFYWLQATLLHFFVFEDVLISWVYVLSLLPFGLFAWNYFSMLRLFLERWKWWGNDDDLKKELGKKRMMLVENLAEL